MYAENKENEQRPKLVVLGNGIANLGQTGMNSSNKIRTEAGFLGDGKTLTRSCCAKNDTNALRIWLLNRTVISL